MKFNYKWTLKDSAFTKDKGTVFSTFSGGGGSSMGYLLAGYNIIGCNEIDKRMMNCYKSNLPKCKYYYLESITKLVKRKNLPLELFNLDILDGSPPCSSFTNAGKRSKYWGVQKKFLEGQEEQVLDTLFFEFIINLNSISLINFLIKNTSFIFLFFLTLEINCPQKFALSRSFIKFCF